MKHDTTNNTSDSEGHDGCDDGTANTAIESNKNTTYDKVPINYSGTVYTCPMHPEVRDVEDSGCPICGMALKPEESVAEMAETEDSHASCHGDNDSDRTSNTELKSVSGGKYDKVPDGYSGTVYICPMHPEVRDIEDSRCPLCNMFLKPEESVAEMAETEDSHASCHSNNHSTSNTELK